MVAQHGSASVKEMHAASISAAASGSVTYDALTLNAYRYGSIYHSVLGYIGLGVGYGRIQAPAQANLEGCNCFGSAKGSGAVYQWRVGVEYPFTTSHAVFAQYSQLYLPAASSTGASQYGRKGIGSVGLGYRWHF